MSKDRQKNRQSFYFPDGVLELLSAESVRLDRSISWIAQYCIRKSLPTLKEMPDAPPKSFHEM